MMQILKEKDLTANEIYELLLQGKKVQIPISEKEIANLLNHLNVIKSRDKKLKEDLQLDWERAIISTVFVTPNFCEFSLIKPNPNKLYHSYVIDNS